MRGKPYSMDLRERVIMDVDGGLSVASVARKYRVSEWWIHQLKKRRAETGSIAPGKQGGCKERALAASLDVLAALVKEYPDATLDELREMLAKRGIEAKRTTLWNNLEYAGLSVKKNRSRYR